MRTWDPRANELFLKALELHSLNERQAFLDKACGFDAARRAEVESLLDASARAGSFLEPHAAALDVTVDLPPASAGPGTVIGAYKLLEQIGEGGFGIVFMAEQMQPMRRKVALKVLKPGMDTRQVVARFEAERQTLAIMDHPNIAKVHDAGATASGRPYFVMELVKGVPITEFCDQNQLTPRKRLELFVTICHAVQHAHQKGIIHRDLKPSNVLVTVHDTTPVVKVIDFGVAKALARELADKTFFTGFAQLIGTPLYMSPEQAGPSGLDIDTRSDIYSLGVLIYELLTGSTPLDQERFKNAAYDEIRRIVREEEPPKPSTRLSASEHSLRKIAAQRQTEPAKLTKLVRGELDWIVMKALEKDRNRRYETASALAADVQRYLSDEPVQACPPSAAYRLRKFVRRNRVPFMAASVIAFALLVAMLTLAMSSVLVWQVKNNLQVALQRERRDAYFHRITLAHRELLVNNLGGAVQLLGECQEELRGWEWHYLQRLCRVDPVTIRRAGRVYGLAISRDGRRLAAGNEDGTIGLFDLETGAELPALRGHTRAVKCVAFHPQGTRLASASADCTLRVWDVTTGQHVFRSRGHADLRAYGVGFSPDGRRLAANDVDSSVVLYDMADGHELRRLTEHERMGVCLDFSPDSRLLVTGTWTGMLRVWNAETGDLLRALQGHDLTISAAKFSPDGRRLATVGYDRLVKLWEVSKLLDPTNRDEPRTWRGHGCIITGLAFSPDGQRLATIGGEDKTVKLWDPLTGREILKLRDHAYFGACVVFSADGRRLASSGWDGTVRIRDASPASAGQELRTLRHEDEVWSVAFSPDGQRIASCGRDKTVRLWDAATGAALDRLPLSSMGYLIAFSRDSHRLAAVSRDKTARIWDVATGQRLRAFATPNNHLYGLTFSPDGQYLVVDDVGGKHAQEGESDVVTVWDARDDQVRPKVIGIVGRHGQPVWSLKFSPDGKLLASGSNDGTVKLWRWDPSHPERPHEVLHKLPVRNYGFGDLLAFAPNSQYLVTVGEEHAVKIWDVKTGELVHRLHGHSGDVIAVAVSPDGRWLSSAGEDTTVVLWAAANLSKGSPAPERRHTLRGHTGMVMSLAFSPDGRRLVSGSRDGTVKVWDMTRWDRVPDHRRVIGAESSMPRAGPQRLNPGHPSA
jgi:WD40 repeat protein/serine/threonine protein kinase